MMTGTGKGCTDPFIAAANRYIEVGLFYTTWLPSPWASCPATCTKFWPGTSCVDLPRSAVPF